MDFYKKIFKSKNLRFRILSALRFVPDKPMLRLQYRIKCGRPLNLKDPKRYTEKIQWYKLFYRDPVMQQCADKYQVRKYVEDHGLGHILNELYDVFETPEDIRLDHLPEQFVLKLSNGSGTNLLCRDKSELKLPEVQQKFRDYLVQSGSSAGREWVYKSDKKVIVAEKLLEDPLRPGQDLRDYKILCFNGQPEYIICVDGRYTDHYCHVVYDPQWNKQDVVIGQSSNSADYQKPDTLEEMLEIARTLSKDFPAVRIDLYDIGGQILFGEMTYFPWSGYMHFQPDEFDFILGEKFTLRKN
jgi:hypothetical protein